jgi:hypothetical protein
VCVCVKVEGMDREEEKNQKDLLGWDVRWLSSYKFGRLAWYVSLDSPFPRLNGTEMVFKLGALLRQITRAHGSGETTIGSCLMSIYDFPVQFEKAYF